MNIEHLKQNFEKRKTKIGKYMIGPPAKDGLIKTTEQRLSVVFPEQIKLFYSNYDGLVVETPHLVILSLNDLEIAKRLIHFATFDHVNKIFFDTDFYNEAGQWNINGDKGFLITLTLASFWSNKIWAWLDKQRRIWCP